MLRLKVVARLDGTLEARGILSGSLRVVQENGRPVCTYGDVSLRNSKPANYSGLTFRALLTEEGTRRVELARI